LKNIRISDWSIKLGALVLAFFLWFHAVSEHLYEKELDIRLQVEDPPLASSPGVEVIVASRVPDFVHVLARGRGKDLLRLGQEDFVLRLQAEGSVGEVRTYRLTTAQIEKRATELEVQIGEILEPREIEIVLDRRVEREVPIRPRVEVQVAEGHVQVGDIQVEPLAVRVAGPRRQVSKLEYINTDSLVLGDIGEDVDFELPLRRPPETRLILNPERVRVRADIQILAEDDIPAVPVALRNAGVLALKINPASVRVKVRGGVEIIAGLDAEALDLYVDYREYQGDSLLVRVAEMGPFEIMGIEPHKVEVEQAVAK
jgi:YbbR domain-containing protein